MKRDELLKRGIRQKTLDAMDIDVTRAVIDEEFGKRVEGCYRERSVDRLVGMGVPFSADCNLIYEMAERYMRMVCPYCGRSMTARGGGGTTGHYHVEFTCPCKAKMSISLHDDGISADPSRRGES